MKAVRLHGREDLRVEDIETPSIGSKEVLLRVKAASICGTDLHIYHGGYPPKKTPIILGHEYSGVIEEVGPDVKGFEKGDRVAGSPIIPCGSCYYCSLGKPQLCERRLSLGVEVDGCFTELMMFRRPSMGLTEIPGEISFETGALIGDLLSTGLHAVERAGIEIGDTVTIFGVGPIGLVSVMGAKARGASHIIAVARTDSRLELAREMGADLTINPVRDDVIKCVRDATNGRGADAVIETSAAQSALDNAVSCVRRGGRISTIALYDSRPNLDLRRIVLSEIEIRGGLCPVGPKRLRDLVGVLKSGRFDLSRLITHRFPLEKVHQAIQTFENKLGGAVKVLLIP